MQDHPRLHVDPGEATLSAGAVLEMREAHAHYLGAVLRRGPGDLVRLFNARDGEWQARIERMQKGRRGSFAVAARLRPAEPESGPLLLFAPVKRDATDLLARMATELGARGLWPVLTGRTNAARVNTGRLRAIATEAAEQCERLSVPEVAEPRELYAVLSDWPAERTLHAAIERLAGPEPASGLAPDALLVGPEGGFTPGEIEMLRRRPFVVPISLGSRILRTETACAAGLACLQAAREHWATAGGGGGVALRPRASSVDGASGTLSRLREPCPPRSPTEPDVEPP